MKKNDSIYGKQQEKKLKNNRDPGMTKVTGDQETAIRERTGKQYLQGNATLPKGFDITYSSTYNLVLSTRQK